MISLEDAVSACDIALKAESESQLRSACQALGNMLQVSGRFSAAVQWHTWAVAPPENRKEMFARLGALYGQQQRWQEAIVAYQQAVQWDVDYAPAHWSLANLYGQVGDRAAEIYHRERAIQCNPNWATPKHQFDLGNDLMAEQRSEEAIVYYRGSVERHPDFFEAHYNLAVALMQQQNWTEAQAALQRSIELEPNHAPAYYALGQIAQQQEDWQHVLNCFSEAVKRDPNYRLAWSALGEACLKLQEWDGAIEAYQQAIQLGADSAWTYHNLGYALFKQQQFDSAITWLQRAIEVNPQPWFYLHWAEIEIQRQDWRTATEVLLTAVQLQPDLDALYSPLGRSLRHWLKQDGDRTDVIVESLLQPESRQVEFYCAIAQSLIAYQQYEGAALFYRLAVAQDASLEPQLQQVQMQQNYLNHKIADLYWTIDQFPQADDGYTRLAHLLADQGEMEAAIALHRKALGCKGWQKAIERQYVFTRDWFTHNIPIWTEQLREWVDRSSLRALEIGCFEGMASCWLLDHVLTATDARLVCVDRYLQENFLTNIDRATIHPANGVQKVVRHWGDSHRVLPRLESASFDLIYVSGDPRASHIQKDGELSWNLLKPNGLLIFDYYGWVNQEPIDQRSSLGIDAFIDSMGSVIEVLHRGYQVIVRKREG